MSTFDQHCHESMLRFGQAFEEVHRWLDEFQGPRNIGCGTAGSATMKPASGKRGPCLVFCEVFQRLYP